MRYRFRLRIATKQDGKFAFDAAEEAVALADGLALRIVARNADTLNKATTFHLEAGGFDSESSARAAGERLRVRLRLLNAVLGLGINVPSGDSISASASPEVKEKALRELDAVAMDSVWGWTTFPDDDRHYEYVLGGNFTVRPSDPSYLLTGLKTLWALEVTLDQASEEALHILGLATLETSEKAAFLTCYLAVEQLIERNARSTVAIQLIEQFRKQVKKASARKRLPLSRREADSLAGALAALREESFSSALMSFANSLSKPTELKGRTPQKFLSACIGARNRIAHQAALDPATPLPELTDGLRELALSLIWTRNRLPPLSIVTPPSSISIPDGGLKMRVL